MRLLLKRCAEFNLSLSFLWCLYLFLLILTQSNVLQLSDATTVCLSYRWLFNASQLSTQPILNANGSEVKWLVRIHKRTQFRNETWRCLCSTLFKLMDSAPYTRYALREQSSSFNRDFCLNRSTKIVSLIVTHKYCNFTNKYVSRAKSYSNIADFTFLYQYYFPRKWIFFF